LWIDLYTEGHSNKTVDSYYSAIVNTIGGDFGHSSGVLLYVGMLMISTFLVTEFIFCNYPKDEVKISLGDANMRVGLQKCAIPAALYRCALCREWSDSEERSGQRSEGEQLLKTEGHQVQMFNVTGVTVMHSGFTK